MAQTIEKFDRSTLGPKTRVHALAKQLGMTSKELIVALDGLGLVKVAQSNLSLDEANKLLDALQPAEPSEPAVEEKPKKKGKKKAKKQPEDKIRKRVEKNVANEIHQIEEKVDRELSELLDEDEGIDAEALAILIPEVPEPTEEPVTQVHPFATPVFLAPEAVEEDLEVETSVSDEDEEDSGDADDTSEDGDGAPSKRKRRGRRGKGRGRGAEAEQTEDEDVPEGPVGIKGSTRLEAQRRRRTERREEERKKRHVVSEAEFLARRESVDRTMVVRERQRNDHPGLVTQVGVLEDDLLVEHFVTSESQSSLVGNIYLGRVQNVLPSMEAAFIDIGKGRNGVLYAGEVDWRARGLGGRGRKIEQALKSGDQVLVQVTKDPVGHKGARLTTQISLAGRYLVYVPSGRATGISRKLPENERKRLKSIVKDVVPDKGGAIIRTAAEVEELAASVPDTGDVFLVPAFAGLGAPDWDGRARGALIGMTRGTTRAHIARAALEAIALQSADVFAAMSEDAGLPLQELRVDGGASRNNLLMQMQADALGVPVVRPHAAEITALGAARLAGLAAGFRFDEQALAASQSAARRFEPQWPESLRRQRLARWREAVARAKDWARG